MFQDSLGFELGNVLSMRELLTLKMSHTKVIEVIANRESAPLQGVPFNLCCIILKHQCVWITNINVSLWNYIDGTVANQWICSRISSSRLSILCTTLKFISKRKRISDFLYASTAIYMPNFRSSFKNIEGTKDQNLYHLTYSQSVGEIFRSSR
jgi:hypothetical protein